MRAAIVGAGGRCEVVAAPDPSPSPGELLLRVTACGLCGSDLKARAAMPPGTIMGHEFGGEIVGVGSSLTGWQVGTQVAVLPVLPCGRCAWCSAGYVAHCPSARMVGLGGSPGGFAELSTVSPLAAFALPAHIPPVHGALVEPFAVGLHVIRTAELTPGEDVLVIGAGTVGLTTAAWAHAEGARRITVVDPVSARLEAAQLFGATDVLTSAGGAGPGSYDLVVECVGKPGLLDACITATRVKGRIVVAGVCVEPAPFLPIAALMKELSLRFAVYYTPDEFRTVIDAFASGRIDPALLVGRTADLSLVNDAFDDLSRTAVNGKILLLP